MTAISANPMPPAAEPVSSGSGAPASGAAGGSFADTLLAVLDRAIADTPGASADRFASGTMRSSVERFNERGFFEDRATSDPGASLASGSGAAPGGVPQPASPTAMHPLLQSDPLAPPLVQIPPASPPVALPVGMLVSDPGASDQLAAAGSRAIGSRPSAMADSPPGAIVPLASVPIVGATSRTAEGPASPEGPARAVLHRDPANSSLLL